ncbi:hypothetical protein AX769_08510 [Frondihabitans sp. PAMC 28766]|uniref:hypothetical protein n=1 Tax=Frondihabitans sp. PAMC 28766 TaxID=1795630 RepID=UPI00078C1E16|nr:hypothetical protein [Frondihabitans sp. PAMC 28766]AMM20198.1 hypothetical protein AX769_08510 [Frondihabitans sp. PAMC 28766]
MTAPVVDTRGADELPLTVVTTDRLRLVFAPTRGARLLSLQVDGLELLWQNPALVTPSLEPAIAVDTWPRGDGAMSTWANVGGSKTWPAPQGWGGEGEWAGPPDQVLDSGAWSLTASAEGDSAVVTMTSPDDPRSGLRISRRFTIPSGGLSFRQETAFTNVVARPVRWSIWEVCQVDTSAGSGRPVTEAAVVVPVAGGGRLLDLGTWYGSVDATTDSAADTRADGGAVRLPVGTAVAKRGFADVPGTVSYTGPDGAGISLHQAPVAGATYPDGGAQVEVWLQTPTPGPIAELGDLHPAADLVELELLGPLVTLMPGESTAVAIGWTVSAASASEGDALDEL